MSHPVVLQICALWLLLVAALLSDGGSPRRERQRAQPAGAGSCPFCGLDCDAAEVGGRCPCWDGWGWF